jgi:hypothetical protein
LTAALAYLAEGRACSLQLLLLLRVVVVLLLLLLRQLLVPICMCIALLVGMNL